MEKRHPNHPGELSIDAKAAERSRSRGEIHARARAIEVLLEAEVPFLVGGAYAFATYTGIYRDTKDLDLFPIALIDTLAQVTQDTAPFVRVGTRRQDAILRALEFRRSYHLHGHGNLLCVLKRRNFTAQTLRTRHARVSWY